MRILIVGLVENEQLDRLKEEGEKRGHTVKGCFTSDLIITADPSDFEVSLKDDDFSNYDLIYLWVGGKRRWEWSIAVKYIHKKYGTKIVNSKVVDEGYSFDLTSAADYWKQQQLGLPFPKSAIIFTPKAVDDVIDQFSFPVIMKASGGNIARKGKSLHLLNSAKEVKEAMKPLLEQSPAVVLREFIPNDGDIRIFTVGYKAIGAMKRTPKEGDFRSNISQGGSGATFDLSTRPDIKKIAEQASEMMRTEIAGVDIMIHKETNEPYILEINAGPQFMGLEEYTDTNAALEIIKYFEQLSE